MVNHTKNDHGLKKPAPGEWIGRQLLHTRKNNSHDIAENMILPVAHAHCVNTIGPHGDAVFAAKVSYITPINGGESVHLAAAVMLLLNRRDDVFAHYRRH